MMITAHGAMHLKTVHFIITILLAIKVVKQLILILLSLLTTIDIMSKIPGRRNISFKRLKISLDTVNHHDVYVCTSIIEPTQIYRYLGTHHRSPPIFLHRTLSYMKCRRCRPIRHDHISIDNIANRLVNELQEKKMDELPDFTINITSFTDPLSFANVKPSTISVKASVVSVFRKSATTRRHPKNFEPKTEKKRISVGIWEVPVNVDAKSKSSRSFSFHVDNATCFQSPNATFEKSSLVFVAYPKPCYPSPVKNTSSDADAPSKKRRKQDINFVYRAEVLMYRANEPCSFVPGDYDVHFTKRACPKLPMSSEAEWDSTDEGFEENVDSNSSEMEDLRPSLTIKVFWNAHNSGKGSRKGMRSPLKNQILPTIFPNDHPPMEISSHRSYGDNIRIFYRFSYNSYDAQTTIGKSNFCCPWCSLNCISFKPLKMHLIHCHSRFNFKMTTEVNGSRYEAKVDVTPNEAFDGSYAGNPHHLAQPELGCFFARNGPTRRNSVTLVLVSRKGQEIRNEEYDSDNDDGDAFITQGHDRLYYHTKTCLPIRPQDMDYDSESENDPLWMRTKTQLMIDEFTDVNEGEKEVMKLWNLLIMKYGFNADIQIPEACRVFINEYSNEIFKKNIRYNFILHLNCLYDFGLLDANQMKTVIEQLNEVIRKIRST